MPINRLNPSSDVDSRARNCLQMQLAQFSSLRFSTSQFAPSSSSWRYLVFQNYFLVISEAPSGVIPAPIPLIALREQAKHGSQPYLHSECTHLSIEPERTLNRFLPCRHPRRLSFLPLPAPSAQQHARPNSPAPPSLHADSSNSD